jgi:hypothetical protein
MSTFNFGASTSDGNSICLENGGLGFASASAVVSFSPVTSSYTQYLDTDAYQVFGVIGGVSC